jgi:hypothetical protein
MLGFEAVTEDRLADIEAFRRWPELKVGMDPRQLLFGAS